MESAMKSAMESTLESAKESASKAQTSTGSERPNPAGGAATASGPLLRLSLQDIGALRRCYLSFLRRGGLFLRGAWNHPPRTQLLLILRLPRTQRPQVLTARVAWICPPHNPAGLTPGCGLHFDESGSAIRKQIESLLATEAGSSEASYAL